MKLTTAMLALAGSLFLLAGFDVTPASAAWDPACNCNRPDSAYSTKRTVVGAPRVNVQRRYVDHTRVVRGNTHIRQENRLVVHVRPVINKQVVVHRTHTIVKDLVVNRINQTNKYREEYRNVVVNEQAQGSVRRVTEYKTVRGHDCNCYGDNRYRQATYRY